MRVEAGARGGAAQRDLPGAPERVPDAVAAQRDLRAVAAELLAERDGHGVHHVRAPRLDEVGELVGLGAERAGEPLERRQQVLLDAVDRGQVDGRREDVVRRLAHVHVVVRVGVVAGQLGDHLVRVHVRRGARAGLEDVDRELVVVLALGHLVTGAGDALGDLGVEQAELGVDARGLGLDAAEPAHHRCRHALARDREVHYRLGRLGPPELTFGGRWSSVRVNCHLSPSSLPAWRLSQSRSRSSANPRRVRMQIRAFLVRCERHGEVRVLIAGRDGTHPHRPVVDHDRRR